MATHPAQVRAETHHGTWLAYLDRDVLEAIRRGVPGVQSCDGFSLSLGVLWCGELRHAENIKIQQT